MKLKTFVAGLSLSVLAGPALADQVSAPFVDAGTFVITSGFVNESVKFGSPTQHQGSLTGLEKNAFVSVDRNSYLAFDLSDINDQVTGATLRIWGWAPSDTFNGAGVYRSAQATEDLSLHKLDSHTAAQVINAPFDETATGDIDEDIFADLADGTSYGGRTFTAADGENPGLVPNPILNFTPPSNYCDTPGTNACGRWIDIALNTSAIADINGETGTWLFGMTLDSINDPATESREQVFGGNLVDSQSANIDFHTPAPELVLTTVPLPAGVWLLGSCLGALFGWRVRRRH
ncbi:MAG: hypothetical protein AAF493_22545 [Pseudomonadota bacterium]